MAADIGASERASQRFAAEVALARREVDAQRRRLSELDRGRSLARIGNALTVTTLASRSGLDSFSEAEAALAKVVAHNHDARFVREEMAPPAEYLIACRTQASAIPLMFALPTFWRAFAARSPDSKLQISSNQNAILNK